MQIALPQLPKALDGIVLAHVSDTHVGRFVGPKELDAVVAATANLHPDLIVFTGDLIDYNLADLPPALSAMKQLAQIAPLAMCVGNHDLFDDGNAFRNRVRKADVGLMVDEIMPIQIRGEKIDLLGLDWGAPGSPRADGIQQHMQNLLARRRSSAFPILLAHHPHAFDPAAAAGIPLTLSGHTHGGQIMLTHNWGCGRVYKYWSGLYEKGSSKLVVSNGVGNWFPLRIGAPAEIIRLTLRSA
jgi:predicted MPP superfamily phosphohydrolase